MVISKKKSFAPDFWRVQSPPSPLGLTALLETHIRPIHAKKIGHKRKEARIARDTKGKEG